MILRKSSSIKIAINDRYMGKYKDGRWVPLIALQDLICTNCGREIEDETFSYEYEDGRALYCRECFYKLFDGCNCCGAYYPLENIRLTDDGYKICNYCWDNNVQYCECCDGFFYKIVVYYGQDIKGQEISVCKNCLDESIYQCDGCGRFILANQGHWFIEVNDHIYCKDCFIERYVCDDCGAVLRVGECDLCYEIEYLMTFEYYDENMEILN